MRPFSSHPRHSAGALPWLPALTATLAAGLLACGPGPEPDAGGDAATATAVPISGIYDVKGVTRPVKGDKGDERAISGTVILHADGDRYTTTFKLKTTFPGAAKETHADVIGTGEGTIHGRKLAGQTETQLVVSTVPGIDAGFAFIPRIVGARVVSSAETEISADGRVVIDLENRPAEGEDYMPTRTRLTGMRVADTNVRPGPVASAP